MWLKFAGNRDSDRAVVGCVWAAFRPESPVLNSEALGEKRTSNETLEGTARWPEPVLELPRCCICTDADECYYWDEVTAAVAADSVAVADSSAVVAAVDCTANLECSSDEVSEPIAAKSKRSISTHTQTDVKKVITFSVFISNGESNGVGAQLTASSSTASSLTCPVPTSMLAFSGSMFCILLAMSSHRGGRRKTSSSVPGNVRMET